MSREFQIAWPCDHRTVEESVQLGTDRRSLLTRQPIAGSGTVRVMVNDELYVPTGGLFSAAQLYSTASGPFDLTEGDDTLTVETPVGSKTISFGVTGVARMTTDQVISYLKKNSFQVAIVENVNGHLVFSDGSKIGPDSYVKVSSRAAESLGFGSSECNKGASNQRGARGIQLYPSWNLARRPDDLVNRFPVFDYPVKGNPLFKVSYTVIPERCLRCGGSWVENDYRYGTDGQSLMIENENLLYQSCLKMLLTDIGSNPYHTWYGTNIMSRIGAKAISGVSMLLSEDVRKALSKYQSLQVEQGKYQKVTLKEQLYSILNVQVAPHKQDPTTYLIDVTVQNASGKPVALSIVYTAPSAVSLMGSNGLMLGTQSVGLEDDRVYPNQLTINGVPTE